MRVPFIILFVAISVLSLGAGYSGPERLDLLRPQARLSAIALPSPVQMRTGVFTWVGGVRLSSPDPAFGGISALGVRDDTFTLLSDGGNIARFRMGPDWRIAAPEFLNLPGGPRTGWEKRDRDSESLVLGPEGQAWVGFESMNSIWRYSPDFGAVESYSRPRAFRRWPSNGGPEAFARLTDGRFVAISEQGKWPGHKGRAGALFHRDPVRFPDSGFGFSYLPATGFSPVDMAVLPGGDLLVLERQFRLPLRFRSRIALLKQAALKPGATVAGVELARLAPPFPMENYEGIAVTREGGDLIVWLVSDDDQRWWWSNTDLIKLKYTPPK